MESSSLVLNEFVYEELLVWGVIIYFSVIGCALGLHKLLEFLGVYAHEPQLLIDVHHKITDHVPLQEHVLLIVDRFLNVLHSFNNFLEDLGGPYLLFANDIVSCEGVLVVLVAEVYRQLEVFMGFVLDSIKFNLVVFLPIFHPHIWGFR